MPEPQLLKDILESIDQEHMFSNIDQHEEKLVDGLYREDEDFSAIQAPIEDLILSDELIPEETKDYEETKTKEPVPVPAAI